MGSLRNMQLRLDWFWRGWYCEREGWIWVVRENEIGSRRCGQRSKKDRRVDACWGDGHEVCTLLLEACGSPAVVRSCAPRAAPLIINQRSLRNECGRVWGKGKLCESAFYHPYMLQVPDMQPATWLMRT